MIAKTSAAGRICNVSYAFGLMASPNSSAYNASKFAVRGFTEALTQEMRAEFGDRMRVTCVYPGGVKTSIAPHRSHQAWIIAQWLKPSTGSRGLIPRLLLPKYCTGLRMERYAYS
ncbi:SDR family oxidoreductase [Rhodococcus sp. IEGM1428]|uniref:SDR family oxidoreductase n=1 Tax=Rhodococcus sp. IEGM1428 TaxID=3392191 RepID=UPI003D0C4C71